MLVSPCYRGAEAAHGGLVNEDEAVGHMEKNAEGKLAITRCQLRPRVVFSGPNRAEQGRPR